MDRQWISIKGKRLLWTEFIYILDDYRYCKILRERGSDVCDKYNRMICVLQEMTDDYYHGKDSIADQLQDFFECYSMRMPRERRLPEAIEELFVQLQVTLGVDLTRLLDKCVERTEKAYFRIQEEQQKEQKRISVIHSLMKENEIIESEDLEGKIRNILMLQRAKMKSLDYELSEKEINVTKVWCELLVSNVFANVITYGQMLRLVENDLVYESEISELLENKYGIDKDYEWYSEDFMGCGFDELTDIRMEDILVLCTARVKDVLGVNDVPL